MTTAINPVLPHGKLESLAPGLWRVVGSLPMPLPRNMFVYRLPGDGPPELLLYSVVALDAAGMAALEALGKPTIMVVPHPMHTRDAAFYVARYPGITVVGPDGVRGKASVTHAAKDVLPARGVGHFLAPGMNYDELVLDLSVGDGRALIFTDLVGQSEGKPGFLLRLLGAPGGAGVARIVKWRQIASKDAVRAFLRERARTPNLRLVTGCHGGYVATDCAGFLERAASGL